MIDEAQKAKWDNYAIHKAAIDSGLQQGMEKGLKEGLAKGLEKGLAKGLAKGAEQKARDVAKKMLLKNEPIDKIIDFTELSEADVLAIKAALGQS